MLAKGVLGSHWLLLICLLSSLQNAFGNVVCQIKSSLLQPQCSAECFCEWPVDCLVFVDQNIFGNLSAILFKPQCYLSISDFNALWLQDGKPGPTFIKPDQLDPWIKDQLRNNLLSTILSLQLPNFGSCGRACLSHVTQNLVTVGANLILDPWIKLIWFDKSGARCLRQPLYWGHVNFAAPFSRPTVYSTAYSMGYPCILVPYRILICV